MGRGHIHQLLSNPIYAGRIRHRDRVFEGQHPALIDPGRWDAIQVQLQTDAARRRNKRAVGNSSKLCGKLYDETGDRLTPSHSRTRSGARLRYYVSHRLVARSSEAHPDAWRLPAEELESKIAHLAETMLGDPALPAKLIPDASSSDVARMAEALNGLTGEASDPVTLDLIERVDLAPGELTLGIDAGIVAQGLDIERDVIDGDVLRRAFPFQLRKRGVETKIVLGTTPTGLDETLIGNIAKAHTWLERIKAGETFSDIAATETTSKRRIQHLIDLAFLAPDLVRDILDGKQPTGFTSDWAIRHDLPSDWTEQRARIARL